ATHRRACGTAPPLPPPCPGRGDAQERRDRLQTGDEAGGQAFAETAERLLVAEGVASVEAHHHRVRQRTQVVLPALLRDDPLSSRPRRGAGARRAVVAVLLLEIGRASCRERVERPVGAVSAV